MFTFDDVHGRGDGFAPGRSTRVIAVVGSPRASHEQFRDGAGARLFRLEADAAARGIKVEHSTALVPSNVRRRHAEEVDGAREADRRALLDKHRRLAS